VYVKSGPPVGAAVTLLVPGEGGRSMAQKLAKLTGWSVGEVDFKTFPDGEEYARILTPVRGRDVVVVQTGYPPSRVWKLLLLLNASRENGAATVRCVIPYLPYARQDRLFLEGEALTARLVADAVRVYAKEVVTVEPHKDEVAAFFDGSCRSVSAIEPFAREFKSRGIDVVLAPDAGARPRAEAVAARIGAKADHLEKKRLSGDHVEMKPKSLDVRGSRVAIFDDIISTGGTMVKATEQLVKQGAATVLCAGVHGLFIGDAVGRLKMAGAEEVIASDTIESPYSRVSVAEAVASALGVPASVRR
jgi:ribose-phosphate pyrophosphokinase